MPDAPESSHDEDRDAAWREERLQALLRLGSIIATVGWLVTFLGLLIAIRWQLVLGALGAQPAVRFEALASPLLLAAAGVGLGGLGHLLRIVPVVCGIAAPTPGAPGPPRSLAAFLRTMRSHAG
jgi:hypothetical protein